MGTPSHPGHLDGVAATLPSQAPAKAAQEAPDLGQWEGQDVPLVRPSTCIVKGGILSSRRYLPTYLPSCKNSCWRNMVRAYVGQFPNGTVCTNTCKIGTSCKIQCKQ